VERSDLCPARRGPKFVEDSYQSDCLIPSFVTLPVLIRKLAYVNPQDVQCRGAQNGCASGAAGGRRVVDDEITTTRLACSAVDLAHADL
jgi:hypothetical protein